MYVHINKGETLELALERIKREQAKISEEYQKPKKSEDKIGWWDICKIIVEDSEDNLYINKTYCTDEPDKWEEMNTLGKICSSFGIKPKKYMVITIILDRPLDGEIWQYGNYLDDLWHYHGETKGYC